MLELGYDLGEACQRVFDRMLCLDFFSMCVFTGHYIKNYSTITAKLILLKKYKEKFPVEK